MRRPDNRSAFPGLIASALLVACGLLLASVAFSGQWPEPLPDALYALRAVVALLGIAATVVGAVCAVSLIIDA